MDNNFCKDCGGSLIINNERPCTCLGKQTPEERIKEIAGLAWKGAANAFRMYPDSKHTFSSYWESAKDQFKEFEQSQPTKEQIRTAIADYMRSEGCSCCENIEDHEKHKEILANLLDIEPYSDGSGFDFSKYRTPDN